MRQYPKGFSLPELVVVLAIFGLMTLVSLPVFSNLLEQNSLQTACNEVAAILTQARGRAALSGADVGVKWISVGGDLVLTLYEDRNGNGVTTEDIRKGIDRLVAGPYWMKGRYPHIDFSFVPGFDGIDPNGDPVGKLDDAIKFGRSDICTFSPVGKASPGSVYLSNRKARQAMVRVTPMTARISTWTWHGKKGKWIRRW